MYFIKMLMPEAEYSVVHFSEYHESFVSVTKLCCT